MNTKALMARQFKGNKYSATRSGVEIRMMIVVTEMVNTDMTPHYSFNSCVILEGLTKCP